MRINCTAANMGFSAIRPGGQVAGWRINTDRPVRLSAASWCELSPQPQSKFIQHQHFYLSLVTGAELTQNISTTCPAKAGAESPDTLYAI